MQNLKNLFTYAFYFLKYNPLLAVALLIDEIKGEYKYRISTAGYEKLSDKGIDKFTLNQAFSYMPSNYVLLERVFRKVNQFSHNQTILDMGCGKGRALIVASRFGFVHLKGIELVPAYCRKTIDLLTQVKKADNKIEFQVQCMDALCYTLEDNMQVLFFYNPFKERVMMEVIKNIKSSLKRAPRNLYIVYLNPLFRQNFKDEGFKEIYSVSRYKYLKACILSIENKPVGQFVT